MSEKRFTVKQRQGATNYSIVDYYEQLPLSEGIYYKSNAKKLCKWLNEQHELMIVLHEENKRMINKLNSLALEFLNYNMISMGKATEISEMNYYDFLKFRKENGNPMELQE